MNLYEYINLKKSEILSLESAYKKAHSGAFSSLEHFPSLFQLFRKFCVDYFALPSFAEWSLESKVLSDQEVRFLNDALLQLSKGLLPEYLLGFVSFFGLEFKVSKQVLLPRADSELLVQEVLKALWLDSSSTDTKVLFEPCIGSGILSLSILAAYRNTELQAVLRGQSAPCHSSLKIYGTEIDDTAYDLAIQNKKKILNALGNVLDQDMLVFQQADLFFDIPEKVDILYSNPPYLKHSELKDLSPSVRSLDPELALDGGEDGLCFYRRILSESRTILSPNALIFFEHAPDQYEDLQQLVESMEDFIYLRAVKDYHQAYRISILKFQGAFRNEDE